MPLLAHQARGDRSQPRRTRQACETLLPAATDADEQRVAAR